MLYTAGSTLAWGYLNNPGRTAELFLPDPFGPPGSRMHRTGDLARWGTRGDLVFTGRAARPRLSRPTAASRRETRQLTSSVPTQPEPAPGPNGAAPSLSLAQAVLRELFAELLGVDEVDPQDSFFDLGGHSMLVVQLVRAIQARLGTELPIRAVFERHTPAELAEAVLEVHSSAPMEGRSQ